MKFVEVVFILYSQFICLLWKTEDRVVGKTKNSVFDIATKKKTVQNYGEIKTKPRQAQLRLRALGLCIQYLFVLAMYNNGNQALVFS
jgi:hypothetical protein